MRNIHIQKINELFSGKKALLNKIEHPSYLNGQQGAISAATGSNFTPSRFFFKVCWRSLHFNNESMFHISQVMRLLCNAIGFHETNMTIPSLYLSYASNGYQNIY